MDIKKANSIDPYILYDLSSPQGDGWHDGYNQGKSTRSDDIINGEHAVDTLKG